MSFTADDSGGYRAPCSLAVLLASAAALTLPATSCGDGGTEGPVSVPNPPQSVLNPNVPPVTGGNWYRPGVSTTWQWQLQGQVNTTYDVELYDIDLFDSSTTLIDELRQAGKKVICYFSAGSFEPFRPDSDRFLPIDLGSPLEGFSDERWLDIRSTNVHQIMQDRLDLAVRKNCDGVEPDNVDGFMNDTGFPLMSTEQLAFNRFIANEAHRRGLAVALKNDLDQIFELVSYVDFTVNEQCHEFNECDPLQSFISAGKPALNAEYTARFINSPDDRERLCAEARAQDLRTLVLPLDLDDSFRFSCD